MKSIEYNSMIKVLLVLALLLVGNGYVTAEGKVNHSENSKIKESKHMEIADASTEKASDAYPLTVCPISGDPLDMMGDPVIYNHEGREIRFCCTGCVEEFEKDPKAALAKMDAMIAAAQSDSMNKDSHHSGEKMKDGSDHKDKDANHSEHKEGDAVESEMKPKKKNDGHDKHDHGSH